MPGTEWEPHLSLASFHPPCRAARARSPVELFSFITPLVARSCFMFSGALFRARRIPGRSARTARNIRDSASSTRGRLARPAPAVSALRSRERDHVSVGACACLCVCTYPHPFSPPRRARIYIIQVLRESALYALRRGVVFRGSIIERVSRHKYRAGAMYRL